MSRRRLLTLLVVLGLLGVPAAALRATCVADSCKKPVASNYVVPFCALPRDTRSLIAAGYDEGTSPDVVAVAGRRAIVGSTGLSEKEGDVPWPSLSSGADRIPIALLGEGVRAGPLDAGTELQDVTPSIERILEISPGPVTSGAKRLGQAVTAAEAANPRLVLVVAWKGIGSNDLGARGRDAPFLARAMTKGAGTLDGTTGSLPVDPAATLTSLGTGSVPAQHAVTGTHLRSPYDGSLVRAWDIRTTPTALPTLANDMAKELPGSREVLVATDTADRGVVGGAYFTGSAAPRVVLRPGPASEQQHTAEAALESGLGTDSAADLLVVVMQGSVPELDAATRALMTRARDVSKGDFTAVITASGSLRRPPDAVTASTFVDRLERTAGHVVAAAAASGLFLRPGASAQDVADAMSSRRLGAVRAAEGVPGYAIALEEFC